MHTELQHMTQRIKERVQTPTKDTGITGRLEEQISLNLWINKKEKLSKNCAFFCEHAFLEQGKGTKNLLVL